MQIKLPAIFPLVLCIAAFASGTAAQVTTTGTTGASSSTASPSLTSAQLQTQLTADMAALQQEEQVITQDFAALEKMMASGDASGGMVAPTSAAPTTIGQLSYHGRIFSETSGVWSRWNGTAWVPVQSTRLQTRLADTASRLCTNGSAKCIVNDDGTAATSGSAASAASATTTGTATTTGSAATSSAPASPTATTTAASAPTTSASTPAATTPSSATSAVTPTTAPVSTPVTVGTAGCSTVVGAGLTGSVPTPVAGSTTTASSSTASTGTAAAAPATGCGTTSTASGTVASPAACASNSISIATYGAVGDGTTNNQTAIQNAFNAAASAGTGALIPAGNFAYSGTLTANGIAVCGTGGSSILTAQDVNNEALTLTGSGGSISSLQMTSPATTRVSSFQSAMIWVNNASNYTIQNVLINGSSSVGIFSVGSNNGKILNNTVENTLADSISQITGSYSITIQGNRILNAGDDSVSNVSYIVDGAVVHDITVTGNTILNQIWGQGVTVLGGDNIAITGNHIEGGPSGHAGIYIAAESEWATIGVNTVQVTDNTIINGGGAPTGTGAGAITVYNSQGSTYAIIGVTLSGNRIVNPLDNAVFYLGNGSETGLTENNTDYTNNPSWGFSQSGDSLAAFTETNNQVFSPSQYTTPLVPAGGGCNFTGC